MVVVVCVFEGSGGGGREALDLSCKNSRLCDQKATVTGH